MEHPVMLLVWLLEKVGLLLDKEELVHFAHAYPHLIYTWFFALVLIVLGRLATLKPTLVPGRLQNFFESIIDAIEKFQEENMGHQGRPFFPLMATLIIYVFFCNVNGLIPGSFSPTSNINTTLSLALVIVVLTHIVGVKTHGFSYVKHFLGPAPLLAPLMLPVELVSHLARVISLSLRLFGNVMGEDLVMAILFMLAGQFFVPLPMMFLGLFTGFLQSFIITLLAMVYISDAMGGSH